jgi:hypothetical protein
MGPQFFTRIVKQKLRQVQAGVNSPFCQSLLNEDRIVIFVSNFVVNLKILESTYLRTKDKGESKVFPGTAHDLL